ncbi:MAG: T9SS type A sorting domain-containing protein [Bacteroidetes bacterium]|nr:T9SS type A sorting domain-containing protein [Bacteroidota bacterium]MCL2302014.1 T9SS type A sorting domain-containing protein [Lentimicrobiaceae bacterium]
MKNQTKFKSLILLACFFVCSFNTIANDTITFTWQGGAHKFFSLRVSGYNGFIVHWGDGTIQTTDRPYHSYANTDNYTVTVIGRSAGSVFQSFRCPDAQISTLDVSKAPSLTDLYCNNNQISTLDVSNNTALRFLYCNNNQLSNLDISNNKALAYLDCNNNQLSSLDISNNTALIRLVCSNNQLSNLDLSNNTALYYFDCKNNQLSNLYIGNNTALTYLECSHNRLISLDASNNVALTELYCRWNQLSDLNIENNTALKELYCNNNQLSSLDISNNKALIRLSCDNNQLNSLNLNNNTSLRYLYCYNNQLSSLDLNKNTLLAVLDCNDNQLSSLDVSNNRALILLSCKYNQLNNLNVNNNPSLKYLYCSNNQLSSLDISSSRVLTEIWCFNNQLPLSDLYKISKMINNPLNGVLGTQRLAPQTISIGEPVDYWEQSEFDSAPTDFIVEKNGLLAPLDDYTITDGVITFNNTGYYTITITNDAIASHPNYPAKVIAEFHASPAKLMKTTEELFKIKAYPNPTMGELRIINYELQMGDIAIFDVYGKKVSSFYSITLSNQIDISHLPAGVYFLKAGDEIVKIGKK